MTNEQIQTINTLIDPANYSRDLYRGDRIAIEALMTDHRRFREACSFALGVLAGANIMAGRDFATLDRHTLREGIARLRDALGLGD